MRSIFLSVAAILCCLHAVCADSPAKDKAPELFIECVLGDDVIYERQPVSAVITLFSTSPDVASADAISEVALNKGEFASLQPVSPAGRSYRKTIKGVEYYCYPLRAFMFSMAEAGSYSLDHGEFQVAISIPQVVNDPFWGRVRTSKLVSYKVPVRKSSFKVKSLPNPPESIDFSGSVGKFSIETIIPKGNIYVNEEATAIIVLRGTGLIAEHTMPEYRGAFAHGVKLKSVSESRTAAYDDGVMISELHLECTFIPTSSSDAEIGVVSFDYFDPETKKYVKAESTPVKVDVKSSVSKRQSLSI
ncbi:MAG: hypothetical protein ACI4AK_01210 [Lepagella sp.]